jgi:hypothetical protein
MKALLALNESTTAEIIADVLQIDPEQAEEIAGQMRLSEILDMVQHIKQNSMGEANEIIKPYLAELLSGTGGSKTAAVNKTSSIKPKQQVQQVQQGPAGSQQAPNNVSSSTVGSTRSTVKGTQAAQTDIDAGKEQPDTYNKTITDQNGNMVAQVNGMDQSDTLRGLRTSSKGTGKGRAIRQVTA